ncbi:MAG TPA: valine--tRNA ligase [Gemmatimonadaceae bacterium]|nr:valine--tRNA ligase [Gemmatimonadaceae bacterium]
MTSELSPQYQPAAIERDIYARWLADRAFIAEPSSVTAARPAFTVVMPPPNTTAVLHMGHGLNNTVQDVIVRWRRMAGDETLWVPGTDHAGIATQNVVEKQLAQEGVSRFDLGREAFVQRTVDFVERTGGIILQQLEAIGASCDWSRTAYTLSPELSRAVREAFVRLYDAGLIYRGHRVIHWCPRCLTSLSDEEAEGRETHGKLYKIAYRMVGSPEQSLVVATTRPETMLGDVAVAVNPADGRYRSLIGKRVILPLVGVELPVTADEYADPEFGTGVVKITPAHDANDFEVGRRHGLPTPVVIDEHGVVREVEDAAGRVPAEVEGLDRFEARDRVVERLRAVGALVSAEPHTHNVRFCYRCDTVVEPRLSDQWFVRMAPLAAPALEAVRDRTIRILPERWEAVYVNWLEGIRDWNISRQLWWGHRIPVWYCDRCGGEPIVRREDPEKCERCGGPVRQDEDVLDTWFSSWLWPLSTLGWPNETPDLDAFYPTDTLVTAPEILFFWVARMIMAGYYFLARPPFRSVYLTGTVRDLQHRKMSKSLGNGIDPLDVVRLYGADALRYTVLAGMGLGTDVMLDPDNLEQSFSPGRNFATKLWNIGRFLLANIGEGPVRAVKDIEPERLTRADEWILHCVDLAVRDCEAALGPARPADGAHWSDRELRAGLRLNEYIERARRFVWNELADWYLESTKQRLAKPDEAEVARAVLVHVFDQGLRLLHPAVPFITEALWQRLPVPGRRQGDLLARAEWPTVRWSGAAVAGSAGMRRRRSEERSREFDSFVVDTVTAIRRLRAEYNVPPGTVTDVALVPDDHAATDLRALDEERALVGHLARSNVRVSQTAPTGPWAQELIGPLHLYLGLADAIDLEKECARLSNDLAQLNKQLGSLTERLSNKQFTDRAKPEVVEAERRKHSEWTTRRDQLEQKKRTLCGA